MRFLLNDKQVLDLTCKMLLAGIKIINQSAVDKEKMRNSFKQLLENILCVNNFSELKDLASKMVYLGEDYIEIICHSNYYERKANKEFSF